eukprot:gene23332-30580_t
MGCWLLLWGLLPLILVSVTDGRSGSSGGLTGISENATTHFQKQRSQRRQHDPRESSDLMGIIRRARQGRDLLADNYWYYCLSGSEVTPINIAETELTIEVDDGAGGTTTESIGRLFQFMTYSGTWTGSIRLNCPWMMLVNSTAGQYIDFSVTNSANGSNTQRITTTDNGYRTCSSWAFAMDTFDPCRTSTISLTVDFFVRSVTASNLTTCDVLDPASDGTQVTVTQAPSQTSLGTPGFLYDTSIYPS